MAAVMDDRPRSVLLRRTLISSASTIKAEEHFLDLEWFVQVILRKFDLPGLVVATSPRPCWVLNGTDPNSRMPPETSVWEQYPQKINRASPVSKSVKILVEPECDEQDSYLEWLSKTCNQPRAGHQLARWKKIAGPRGGKQSSSHSN
jgi:hypothetical protein